MLVRASRRVPLVGVRMHAPDGGRDCRWSSPSFANYSTDTFFLADVVLTRRRCVPIDPVNMSVRNTERVLSLEISTDPPAHDAFTCPFRDSGRAQAASFCVPDSLPADRSPARPGSLCWAGGQLPRSGATIPVRANIGSNTHQMLFAYRHLYTRHHRLTSSMVSLGSVTPSTVIAVDSLSTSTLSAAPNPGPGSTSQHRPHETGPSTLQAARQRKCKSFSRAGLNAAFHFTNAGFGQELSGNQQ